MNIRNISSSYFCLQKQMLCYSEDFIRNTPSKLSTCTIHDTLKKTLIVYFFYDNYYVIRMNNLFIIDFSYKDLFMIFYVFLECR